MLSFRLATRLLAALALTLALVLGGAQVALASGPVITGVAPASGSVLGGEFVTIDGSGFQGACAGGYEIWFGTDLEHGYAISAPSYNVLSDTQIQAVVPASFGGPVDVRVHDACGTSPVTPSDTFTYQYPSDQCRTATCTVTIGPGVAGQLGHVALGFLDGFNTDAGVTITPSEAALVGALHPRQWRLGQAGLYESWGGEFGLARHVGAEISLDLTSDWQDWAYNSDHAFYQTPYGDLGAYYSFIYSDVQRRIAAGQVPEYFDVWNEPASSGTINQWLSVYGTAYRAIKAADPSAKVVGPSIASFLLAPAGQSDTPGYEISLTDFLNWEMATGVRMDAVSWHEDGTTVPGLSGPLGVPAAPIPGGFRDYWSPAAIGAHVELAKALIATYPALAGTQVFVNEYGPTYGANIPGWMVGDLASLEQSGADQAMLTCVDGPACQDLFDGLLGSDGRPQMPYWVMDDYSQMAGQRLAASASGSNLYVLASQAGAGGAIDALIGRADDCWGGQQCPQFRLPMAAPVQLAVAVAVPSGSSTATVTVQTLSDSAVNPDGANDVPAAPPATTLANLPVSGGRVQVPVAIGEGDALFLTVTPQASGGATPLGGGVASAASGAPASGARGSTGARATRRPQCVSHRRGRRGLSCSRRSRRKPRTRGRARRHR
jgi:hypothetical protein